MAHGVVAADIKSSACAAFAGRATNLFIFFSRYNCHGAALARILRHFASVTLLDLNACLLPIEAAECSNFQQLTASMSARNSSVEAELAAGDGVQVRCEDTVET